jgi:hypothetical protein
MATFSSYADLCAAWKADPDAYKEGSMAYVKLPRKRKSTTYRLTMMCDRDHPKGVLSWIFDPTPYKTTTTGGNNEFIRTNGGYYQLHTF